MLKVQVVVSLGCLLAGTPKDVALLSESANAATSFHPLGGGRAARDCTLGYSSSEERTGQRHCGVPPGAALCQAMDPPIRKACGAGILGPSRGGPVFTNLTRIFDLLSEFHVTNLLQRLLEKNHVIWK